MLQSVATPRPIFVQRGGYFVRQGFVCAFPKKTQIFLDLPGMKQPLPDSESLRCGCCDKTPSFSSFFFPPESFVSTYTDSHKRMAQITMQQITVRTSSFELSLFIEMKGSGAAYFSADSVQSRPQKLSCTECTENWGFPHGFTTQPKI